MQDENQKVEESTAEEGISFSLIFPIEIVKRDFAALMKRDIMVRRGRNNRMLYKFINREIFDENSSDDEDFTLLGKRKRKKAKKPLPKTLFQYL